MNAIRSAWGGRAEVHAALQGLRDLEGNRDGLWTNEGRPAGEPGAWFERQPLLLKARAFLGGGGPSLEDGVGQLQRFTAAVEAHHGQPVIAPELRIRLHQPDLFAAQKAIALVRLGRAPAEVTEGFVRAAGTVDGQAIMPRVVFFQRFAPRGEPSGTVVLLSPGFQETGRSFEAQIDRLCREGHDVVAMDHQWAGQTRPGGRGGLDRGFGAARDVAAMAAHCARLAESSYGERGRVVLFGNSMGAGPGVLGALALNDAGLVQLEDAAMPKGLSAVLQAPFLAPTPGLVNGALQLAAMLPFVNRLAVPSAGVPALTSDPVAAQKTAQGAVEEDVRAQLAAMTAALPDLSRVSALIEAGQGPRGQVAIVHAARDPLADPEAVVKLAKALGPSARLELIDSGNHVFQASPSEQRHALGALAALLADAPRGA
jgi:alpha-beta hydrolase superfamily lysophospholipase